LPLDLLKTAALIAYYQPLRQSKLSDMIGGKAYEHVRELQERNLIQAKELGRTLELTTSRYFPEFFGLKTGNREEIKRYMAAKAGIKGGHLPKDRPPGG
jgi:segregation and condensation protein B